MTVSRKKNPDLREIFLLIASTAKSNRAFPDKHFSPQAGCRSRGLNGARLSFFLYAKGFSLIELVVAIAILSILIALAIPAFLNIQKDAKIAQAKNALATILKECNVAVLRAQGGNISLQDIPSAQASLSGYEIVSLSNPSPSLGDCVKSENANGDGGSFVTIEALPTSFAGSDRVSDYPSFLLEFNTLTGELSKSCFKTASTKYGAGCNQDTTGRIIRVGGRQIFVPNQALGSWD